MSSLAYALKSLTLDLGLWDSRPNSYRKHDFEILIRDLSEIKLL